MAADEDDTRQGGSGQRVLFGPSRIGLKTVFTACAGITLFIALIYTIWHTRLALFLTIAAVLIAVPLDHGVRFLTARGARRWLAIISVLSLLLALMAGIGSLLIPQVVEQVDRLVEEGPKLLERVRGSSIYRQVDDTVELDRLVSRSIRGVKEHPEEVAQHAFSVAGYVLAAVGGLVTVLFVAAFMLVYGSGLVQWTIEQALPQRRARYRRAAERVYRVLGGYITGITGIVLVNMLTTTIFLAILGVPYFLPLGVLAGLSSLIPVLGITLSGVLIAVIATVTLGVWYGVAVGIYIVVYQQFENHVLAPMVYKRTVEVNPLLSILMVLFLGELLGIVGAVLAVPVLAVLKIIVSELLLLRAEQRPEVTGPTP